MRSVLALFVAVLLAVSPAHAEDVTLKCVGLNKKVQKKTLQRLVDFITQELQDLGWSDVSVKASKLKISGAPDVAEEAISTLSSDAFFSGTTLTVQKEGKLALALSGRLAAESSDAFDCFTKSGGAKILVSGSAKDSTGKSVTVKKVPVDLSGVSFPGIRIPG